MRFLTFVSLFSILAVSVSCKQVNLPNRDEDKQVDNDLIRQLDQTNDKAGIQKSPEVLRDHNTKQCFKNHEGYSFCFESENISCKEEVVKPMILTRRPGYELARTIVTPLNPRSIDCNANGVKTDLTGKLAHYSGGQTCYLEAYNVQEISVDGNSDESWGRAEIMAEQDIFQNGGLINACAVAMYFGKLVSPDKFKPRKDGELLNQKMGV